MTSTPDEPFNAEKTEYVSDSMASSSDDSVMETASCSTSKKVKRKNVIHSNCSLQMCTCVEETEALVARIMANDERQRKLMKYRETGFWDGEGEITDEDYRVMLDWQAMEKEQHKSEWWRGGTRGFDAQNSR